MSPSLSPRKPVLVAPKETARQDAGQNWLALVESIKRGERSGMEELYRVKGSRKRKRPVATPSATPIAAESQSIRAAA